MNATRWSFALYSLGGIIPPVRSQNSLPCSIWRERDIDALAVDVIKQPEQRVRDTLAALGRGVAGSWRAEQKMAALAAWLVLAAKPRAKRTA